MDVSQARLDANRENAQHSTGPKTEEGKRVSSLNALRTGLNSPIDVLPHEDMQAFLVLGKEFKETWQPQGAYEEGLVQKMASQDWRLRRCASLENSVVGLFEFSHRAFVLTSGCAFADGTMGPWKRTRQHEKKRGLKRRDDSGLVSLQVLPSLRSQGGVAQ